MFTNRFSRPWQPLVLVVADEWFSLHGGLSTFNRGMCAGLVGAGATVICLVPDMSDAERDHAARHGVWLVAARPVPGRPAGMH